MIFNKSQFLLIPLLIIFVMICALDIRAQNWNLNWSPGVDEHTIALWLFDEPDYRWVTLTDASPNKYDLRLQVITGALVDGKYGNALKCAGRRQRPAAEFACPTDELYRPRAKYYNNRPEEQHLALLPGTIPEDFNLGWRDWTIEFWFKADASQAQRGAVYSLGGINYLALDEGSERFILGSFHQQLELAILTDASKMSDGKWHHLAFTYSASYRQVRHFVDGIMQPLPEKGGFLPMMGEPGLFTIGNDLDFRPLNASLDEYRISSIARYKKNFTVPKSFSNNFNESYNNFASAVGPVLIFEKNKAKIPVKLGSRKHVFIDDVIIDRMENINITTNLPSSREITDFKSDRDWDATPRFGAGLPDVTSVWDDGDSVKLCYYNGAFWGGKKSAVCIASSHDGIHWKKPNVGTIFWNGNYGSNSETGTFHNNIVLAVPSQGTMFKDTNPNAPKSERYKYITWAMQRGMYLFVSPDGYRWRRNETILLPFETGGGCEAFWDDQRGKYVVLGRNEGHLADPRNPKYIGRSCSISMASDVTKPWPFNPIPNPKRRQTWDSFSLPSITEELPIVIPPDSGQVYRSRAIKYQWAPDVYVAFAWRYFKKRNIRPGCELMVSRDGINWVGRGEPYYITRWNIEGKPKMQEALSIYGLVRRDNEIWQYAQTRFTSHGGANYGGIEYEGGIHDCLVLLKQRLDGFVSLDAHQNNGYLVTKPLIFDGAHLELNVNSKEAVRVALLDENEKAYPGFSLEDCVPIKDDNVQEVVQWKQGIDVSALAGKTIRLKIELNNAKLYAFEFVK